MFYNIINKNILLVTLKSYVDFFKFCLTSSFLITFSRSSLPTLLFSSSSFIEITSDVELSIETCSDNADFPFLVLCNSNPSRDGCLGIFVSTSFSFLLVRLSLFSLPLLLFFWFTLLDRLSCLLRLLDLVFGIKLCRKCPRFRLCAELEPENQCK